MKKIIFISTILLVSFIMPKTVNAQTVNYVWNAYGMSFSIPSTHQVKHNTAQKFESGDSYTWLEIYPYKDYSATPKGMVENVARIGNFTIEDEGQYTSGKYTGYWIRCVTPAHPAWKFWIIGFIDPNSDVNFYAKIWWKKGNKSAYNQAYNISYSFK